MKTSLLYKVSILNILAAALFAVSPVRAAITGTDPTPMYTYATNWFDDTASVNSLSQSGSYNYIGVNPWDGSVESLPHTVDSHTGDSASGSTSASFAGDSYLVNLNETLTQASGNTGHADFGFWFGVHYLLDAYGLPIQPTISPDFLVSGTINAPGDSASITGHMWYYDSSLNLLDTVNYNWTYSTVGSFSNLPVSGTAVNGTTPALAGDFYVFGNFDFQVDPGTLSVVTVPEPSGGLLLGLAGLCGLLWRRWAVKQAALSASSRLQSNE